MIDGLLALANELAEREDGAARRRAVSTAYYAAFHAVCEMMAEALVGDRTSPLFEKVYRHVDHKVVDKKRTFGTDGENAELIETVRTALVNLRQRRELADYSPSADDEDFAEDARGSVQAAREIIRTIQAIDPSQRHALALNVILDGGKQRGAYTRSAATDERMVRA
jgi:hypothetical protein